MLDRPYFKEHLRMQCIAMTENEAKATVLEETILSIQSVIEKIEENPVSRIMMHRILILSEFYAQQQTWINNRNRDIQLMLKKMQPDERNEFRRREAEGVPTTEVDELVQRWEEENG